MTETDEAPPPVPGTSVAWPAAVGTGAVEAERMPGRRRAVNRAEHAMAGWVASPAGRRLLCRIIRELQEEERDD